MMTNFFIHRHSPSPWLLSGLADCHTCPMDDFRHVLPDTPAPTGVIVEMYGSRIDGLRVLEHLRSIWGWQPGVLALVDKGDIVSALQAGADVAMDGTVSPELLHAALNGVRRLSEPLLKMGQCI